MWSSHPPRPISTPSALYIRFVREREARAEGLTDAAVIAERYGVPLEMVHAHRQVF